MHKSMNATALHSKENAKVIANDDFSIENICQEVDEYILDLSILLHYVDAGAICTTLDHTFDKSSVMWQCNCSSLASTGTTTCPSWKNKAFDD
ncbi:hypothetical protein AVEN_84532-1 [Araneus ventricosus]|uniref:Uncharacterized protein n=1 Tax=Araneus ventricosus TaxID=182803 RepID=A0A4Y2FB12_ARAVE|nr:hypothetical protein AVEN_84532-1 [Araneus ventricosus]